MQNPHQKTPVTAANGRSVAQQAAGTGVSLPAPGPLQLKGETPGIQEEEMMAAPGAYPVERFTLPNEQHAGNAGHLVFPPPWRAPEPPAGIVPSRPPLQPFTLQLQLRDPVTAPGKVAQLTSAQVRVKKGKITGVIIRGRPPRIFGDSMGDHTTAFTVQTEGINIALEGVAISRAVEYMEDLAAHLEALPGLLYIQKDSVIFDRFSKELNTLKVSLAAARKAIEANTEDLALSYLQQVISAYLDARELVPFSTVNVGVKSKGTAGRGHGESRGAKILSAFERGEKVENADLLEGVYKLFDERSAGMVSVENNLAEFALLTGSGVDKAKLEGIKIIDRIWEQHKQSIKKLFPKVYAAVKDELEKGDFTQNLEKIRVSNIKNLISDVSSALLRIHFEAGNISENFSNNKAPIRGNKINITHLRAISGLYAEQRSVMDLMEEIYQLNEELDHRFDGDLVKLQQEIANVEKQVLRLVPQYKSSNERVNKAIDASLAQYTGQEKQEGLIKPNARDVFTGIQDFKGNNPFGKFNSRDIKLPEGEDDSGESELSGEAEKGTRKKPAPDVATLTSQLSPMAIQVILDDDGNISEMLSSGRPPSPFMQTMGAHTTAWAVHLDRIRTRIIGQPISVAAQRLLAMTAEVLDFAENRQHLQSGNNVRNVLPAALEDIENNKKVEPAKASLAIIQEMIGAILTYFNLIPGVSVNKIDTTGHGEGKWRGILLKFEKHRRGASKQTIAAAVKGLKDGGNNELHGKYIAEAYPNSWKYLNSDDMADMMDEDIADEEVDKLNEAAEPEEEAPQGLNDVENKELEDKKADGSWLTHINNCLINAIADAAGVPRANADTIIRIRKRLGVPVGRMLTATTGALDIILEELHLDGTGIVVVYQGQIYVDESSNAGDHPVFIYHDGINHFTPLYGGGRKNKEKETTVKALDEEEEESLPLVKSASLSGDFSEEEEEDLSSPDVDLFGSGNSGKRKRKISTGSKVEETGSYSQVRKKAKSEVASQQGEEEEEEIVTSPPGPGGDVMHDEGDDEEEGE